jgi:hypothetical protein
VASSPSPAATTAGSGSKDDDRGHSYGKYKSSGGHKGDSGREDGKSDQVEPQPPAAPAAPPVVKPDEYAEDAEAKPPEDESSGYRRDRGHGYGHYRR